VAPFLLASSTSPMHRMGMEPMEVSSLIAETVSRMTLLVAPVVPAPPVMALKKVTTRKRSSRYVGSSLPPPSLCLLASTLSPF
jgi:NO-binding membrane sensor protein with MHYT domain